MILYSTDEQSKLFFAKLCVEKLVRGLCSCEDKVSDSTLVHSGKRKEIGAAIEYGVQDTPCISISELGGRMFCILFKKYHYHQRTFNINPSYIFPAGIRWPS